MIDKHSVVNRGKRREISSKYKKNHIDYVFSNLDFAHFRLNNMLIP